MHSTIADQTILSEPADTYQTAADDFEIAQAEQRLEELFARHGVDPAEFDRAMQNVLESPDVVDRVALDISPAENDRRILAALNTIRAAQCKAIYGTETPAEHRERLDRQQNEFFGGHPDSEDYCTTGN